jgi:hypothetical protein
VPAVEPDIALKGQRENFRVDDEFIAPSFIEAHSWFGTIPLYLQDRSLILADSGSGMGTRKKMA